MGFCDACLAIEVAIVTALQRLLRQSIGLGQNAPELSSMIKR
jgi:hypothetical protein